MKPNVNDYLPALRARSVKYGDLADDVFQQSVLEFLVRNPEYVSKKMLNWIVSSAHRKVINTNTISGHVSIDDVPEPPAPCAAAADDERIEELIQNLPTDMRHTAKAVACGITTKSLFKKPYALRSSLRRAGEAMKAGQLSII